MRGRAGKRAGKFKKRLEEGRGGTIAMKCIREMKERWRREKIICKWEQERKEFFREREVKEGEEKEAEYEKIEKRDNQKQKLDRSRSIEISRYNKWYKIIRVEGIPKYLEKGWTEKRWNRVLKFRMGNVMRERLYWEEEEKRKCRMCE